jgi:hypothetical protein
MRSTIINYSMAYPCSFAKRTHDEDPQYGKRDYAPEVRDGAYIEARNETSQEVELKQNNSHELCGRQGIGFSGNK